MVRLHVQSSLQRTMQQVKPGVMRCAAVPYTDTAPLPRPMDCSDTLLRKGPHVGPRRVISLVLWLPQTYASFTLCHQSHNGCPPMSWVWFSLQVKSISGVISLVFSAQEPESLPFTSVKFSTSSVLSCSFGGASNSFFTQAHEAPGNRVPGAEWV